MGTKNEAVQIKGGRRGLKLLIEEDTPFAEVRQALEEKLLSGFFRRGTVISLGQGHLSTAENEALNKLFRRHGVLFHAEEDEDDDAAATPVANTTTVVERTLRGGQEVSTQSSVLVMGNVNPGAQIIAGGSIDVRGALRGTVHAGAFGDRSAVVVADCLMPVQIRIADAIAQPPEHLQRPDRPEKASLKDGRIVIEPIER